jgi:hypothetical protein
MTDRLVRFTELERNVQRPTYKVQYPVYYLRDFGKGLDEIGREDLQLSYAIVFSLMKVSASAVFQTWTLRAGTYRTAWKVCD